MSFTNQALDLARQIYRLEQLLSQTQSNRRRSIERVFSKWRGEAGDVMQAYFKRNCTEFADDLQKLAEERDRNVEWWATRVDALNEVRRSEAVRLLQYDLDRLYEEVRAEKGKLGKIAHEVAHAFDEVVDVVMPGDATIIPDDAGPLVPKPHPVEEREYRPSAPNYLVEYPVFVRYERISLADPTRGMDAFYRTRE